MYIYIHIYLSLTICLYDCVPFECIYACTMCNAAICMYAYRCCAYGYIYMYIYIYIYIYVYVYMNACIHIYIYIYMYTSNKHANTHTAHLYMQTQICEHGVQVWQPCESKKMMPNGNFKLKDCDGGGRRCRETVKEEVHK
jgi:hypothetical protein